MTPAQFKQARLTLGLSTTQMADMLRRNASTPNAGRNYISRVETGRAPIVPLVAAMVRAYLSGYRPGDWPLDTPTHGG